MATDGGEPVDSSQLAACTVHTHAIDRWISRVDPEASSVTARAALQTVFDEAFQVPLYNRKNAWLHPDLGLVIITGTNYYNEPHIITCYWLSEETVNHGVKVRYARYCPSCERYYRAQPGAGGGACQEKGCGLGEAETVTADKQLPEKATVPGLTEEIAGA